ncbi:phosphoesterase [Halarcobacter ebronensis]|uniref:Phosphoesterase n=1 Tax=Halarcobacter ebronensis TaxID=1462615 RepID=A0A4Q0Y7V2_9BACT|nr:phosphatase PAP2 family protein [Halarcobacter ebronensis]RXJ66292.1 phosphoesterase [Halarcobacter ebronensis]
MNQELIKKQIVVTAILLIFVLALFQFTNLDIAFQSFFYNFNTATWIWDATEPISKFILYTGLKKALIIFAVIVLFILILFWKRDFIKEYRFGMIVIVLSAIIVPMTVISLKNSTNTPCPKNIEYFGGNYPDIKVFDSYPKDFVQEGKIRCWPAGHASGGFALMSLFFLFKKRKNRFIALGIAVSIGWIMGVYKMIIGDHFLSHTIITMLIAWLEILIIVKSLSKVKQL